MQVKRTNSAINLTKQYQVVEKDIGEQAFRYWRCVARACACSPVSAISVNMMTHRVKQID